jgi:hypothetical protein
MAIWMMVGWLSISNDPITLGDKIWFWLSFVAFSVGAAHVTTDPAPEDWGDEEEDNDG